jgi:hypothetical protein
MYVNATSTTRTELTLHSTQPMSSSVQLLYLSCCGDSSLCWRIHTPFSMLHTRSGACTTYLNTTCQVCECGTWAICDTCTPRYGHATNDRWLSSKEPNHTNWQGSAQARQSSFEDRTYASATECENVRLAELRHVPMDIMSTASGHTHNLVLKPAHGTRAARVDYYTYATIVQRIMLLLVYYIML